MFVWRAATLLDCIGRYKPAVLKGLQTVARQWHTPRRREVLNRSMRRWSGSASISR